MNSSVPRLNNYLRMYNDRISYVRVTCTACESHDHGSIRGPIFAAADFHQTFRRRWRHATNSNHTMVSQRDTLACLEPVSETKYDFRAPIRSHNQPSWLQLYVEIMHCVHKLTCRVWTIGAVRSAEKTIELI